MKEEKLTTSTESERRTLRGKKKPAPELAKKHWKQCEQCRAFTAGPVRDFLRTRDNNNHYHSHL